MSTKMCQSPGSQGHATLEWTGTGGGSPREKGWAVGEGRAGSEIPFRLNGGNQEKTSKTLQHSVVFCN